MRISLLLRREPFGEILEKTLSAFWSNQQKRVVEVKWYSGSKPSSCQESEQIWLVNAYLNAIFTPGAAPEIFDPVKKEFSRSLSWWKRSIQKIYVALALSGGTARWLSHARLGVTPPVPNARNLVIVAGNHKIRILDKSSGNSFGILKHGFPSHFIEREIQARHLAEKLKLPVPSLKEIAEDQTWFRETYICGTPINRLKDTTQAHNTFLKALDAMRHLYDHTKQEESFLEYAEQLRNQICQRVQKNPLLEDSVKQNLLKNIESIIQRIQKLNPRHGGKITTSLTHGDFQAGNILVDNDKIWIIDWEYAARRQMGYDTLLFMTNARFPKGLAQRLKTYVENGKQKSGVENRSQWPGANNGGKEHHALNIELFLLEELNLKLEEIECPFITHVGYGLSQLQKEINLWTHTNGH